MGLYGKIKKYILLAASALLAVLTLSSCVKDKTKEYVEVGDLLPWFSVTMNDGSTLVSYDLAGTVSLIMFFDTECEDCQATIPIVNQLYLELGIGAGGKQDDDVEAPSVDGSEILSAQREILNDSVTVTARRAMSEDTGDDMGLITGSTEQVRFVLIGRDQDAATVAKYWEEKGFSVPYSPQSGHSVYKLFANSVIPRIYISDPSLFVRYSFNDSPLPTYTDLTIALQSLLED